MNPDAQFPIPVVATDGNGNRRTNNYQVTVPGGATRTFVYDGNGNLLDDGERTYQWDAKNRLIEAKRGADTWQWSYNAFDQRVSEKKNGVVTKRWVWAGGNQPAEERDAAGNVTRRFYPQGEQAGAVKSYYTKDHLGSIREVMGANGTVVSSSRYDAWGVRTTQGAQDAASFGFTGHLEQKELGLVFTLYRAYDPATGRWLSIDPIGEAGGINLYGYVGNNPINAMDPFGLDAVPAPGGGYNFVVRPDLNLGNLAGASVTNTNPRFSGQCATGAQFLAGTNVNGSIHDAPSTSTWRPGEPVSGGNLKPGTMVATGWQNGGYPSLPPSAYGPGQTINHTGIFMGMNRDGTMNLYDQFTGKPLGGRPVDPAGYNAVVSDQKYDPRPSTSAARPGGGCPCP